MRPRRQVIEMRSLDGSILRALAPVGDCPMVDSDFDEYSMVPGDAVFYQRGLEENRLKKLMETEKYMCRRHDGGVSVWRYEQLGITR